MLTTRRGLLAPQNTFVENIIRRCDGTFSSFVLGNARILDYPIVYSSPNFSKLTGFSRNDIMQKPVLFPFLRGPQTKKETMDQLEEAIINNRTDHAEVVIYKKNMNPIWVLVRVTPVRNEKDSIVLLLVTFRDLSAFKTPLPDDFGPGTSGLATFAANSDATTGWGRFARLAAALMRQKTSQNEQDGNKEPTEETNVECEKKDIDALENGATKQAVYIEQEIKTVSNPTSYTDLSKQSKPPVQNLLESKFTGIQQSKIKTSPKNLTPGTIWTTEIDVSAENRKPKKWLKLENDPSQKSYSECASRRTSSHNVINQQDRASPRLEHQLIPKSESSIGFSLSRMRRLLNTRRSFFLLNSRSSQGIFGNISKSTVLASGENDEFMISQSLQSPQVVPRYRPEPPRPPKHVLLHYSFFRIIWDWLILLLTVYTVIVVPIRTLILPQPFWVREYERILENNTNSLSSYELEALRPYSMEEPMAIADAIIDVIFFIDIMLNFHTSFVGPGGEVIADSAIIRLNYLRSWFTLDLISCLPYEIIKYYDFSLITNENTQLNYLRFMRLLRIVRAGRRVDQYMEHVSVLLLLMIVCFFLLAHWFACSWYAIGVKDLEQEIMYGWIPRIYNDSLIAHNWTSLKKKNLWIIMEEHKLRGKPKLDLRNLTQTLLNLTPVEIGKFKLPLKDIREKWSAYLTALYFSLSLLTTIGFGNVAAFTEKEKGLSIAFMMVGALVYATIFGNITTIVQQVYSTRTRYNEKMKGVKDFLKIHEVPRELGERVIDYITSTWAITKGTDTTKVLNYCPKDMQADISVHMNRCVFNNHPAFRLASDGCLRALAVNFNTLHTAPGDLVIHQGESVDQLCFIVSGTLEIIQDDEVVAILSKGEVFGTPNWRNMNQSPSAVSVRALTYCNLHTIRLDCLRTVLDFYHAFANSFTRNLDITYNLNNRFIFRKMRDVKHEIELAERRKKESIHSSFPVDHPMRKIISKFRRSSVISNQDSLQKGSPYSTSERGSSSNSLCGEILSQGDEEAVSQTRYGFSRKISTIQADRTDIEMSNDYGSRRQFSTTGSLDIFSSTSETTIGDKNAQILKPKTISPWVNRAINSHGPARKWARLLAKAQQTSLQNLQEEQEEDKHSGSSWPKQDDTTSKHILDTERSSKLVVNEHKNRDLTSIVMQQRNQIIQGSLNVEDITRKVELAIQQKFDQHHRDFSYHIGNLNSRMDFIQTMINNMAHQVQIIFTKNQRQTSTDVDSVTNMTNMSLDQGTSQSVYSSSVESIIQFPVKEENLNKMTRSSRKHFLEPPKLFDSTISPDMSRRRSCSPTRFSLSSTSAQSFLQPTSVFCGLGSRNPPKLTPPKLIPE